MRVVILGEMYNADLSIGGGPIIPPAQPPGIWPPAGVVSPPIYYPPYVPPPLFPTHPIAPGGPPPGVVSPPIYYPPSVPPPLFPTPPIYLPPSGGGGTPPGIWPPSGVVSPPIYYPPAQPPGIWGGMPWPTPPIYYPPTAPPPEKPPEPPARGGKGNWHYVPGLGWVFYAEGGNWVFVPGDKPRPPSLPEGPPQVNPLPKK